VVYLFTATAAAAAAGGSDVMEYVVNELMD